MELTSAVVGRGTNVKLRDSLVSVDSDAGSLRYVYLIGFDDDVSLFVCFVLIG